MADLKNPNLIALVDDDDAYRSMIEDYLLFQGISVACFSEPERFLQSFREAALSYALVISDVRMPKLSGLELLRQLKAESPHLPVILFTAAPNRDDEALSRKLGAQVYLPKPCKLAEIFKQVQEALSLRLA